MTITPGQSVITHVITQVITQVITRVMPMVRIIIHTKTTPLVTNLELVDSSTIL